ncbi:hypothetical protein [Streptomyces syringium]|uniref:hypothetical protein n=1 Tax=Streptomyces syringium TaxID=76729 RepID=UPI00343C0858
MRLLAYMVRRGDVLVGDAREVAAVRRAADGQSVVLVFETGLSLKVGAMDTLRVARAWPVGRGAAGTIPGGPPSAPNG